MPPFMHEKDAFDASSCDLRKNRIRGSCNVTAKNGFMFMVNGQKNSTLDVYCLKYGDVAYQNVEIFSGNNTKKEYNYTMM